MSRDSALPASPASTFAAGHQPASHPAWPPQQQRTVLRSSWLCTSFTSSCPSFLLQASSPGVGSATGVGAAVATALLFLADEGGAAGGSSSFCAAFFAFLAGFSPSAAAGERRREGARRGEPSAACNRRQPQLGKESGVRGGCLHAQNNTRAGWHAAAPGLERAQRGARCSQLLRCVGMRSPAAGAPAASSSRLTFSFFSTGAPVSSPYLALMAAPLVKPKWRATEAQLTLPPRVPSLPARAGNSGAERWV